MVTAERKAVVGSPDLETLTTSHIERAFLTVRQELKRFQRKGLGYSKDLETHKAAVALFLGVYNFVRKHKTLGITPAVAAGVELEAWDLERVVEMTADYMRRKEEAEFDKAFASRDMTVKMASASPPADQTAPLVERSASLETRRGPENAAQYLTKTCSRRDSVEIASSGSGKTHPFDLLLARQNFTRPRPALNRA